MAPGNKGNRTDRRGRGPVADPATRLKRTTVQLSQRHLDALRLAQQGEEPMAETLRRALDTSLALVPAYAFLDAIDAKRISTEE